MFISYYCRGKCSGETQHEVENSMEDSKGNFAKLKCIKCAEPPFVVEYPKDSKSPDRLSRRVEGVLIDDEQPGDICLH